MGFRRLARPRGTAGEARIAAPGDSGGETFFYFRHQGLQFGVLIAHPRQQRFIAATLDDHLLSQGRQKLKELSGDRLVKMAQGPTRPHIPQNLPVSS